MISLALFSRRKLTLLSTATVLSFGMVACGGAGELDTSTPDASSPDAAQAPAEGSGETVAISGAGASFPAPLYQRWFDAYNSEVDPAVQVSYQSVGSGAGLEQYIAGTVDFGASDAPIEGDRLKSFQDKYSVDPIQVPMAGGAVVFAYNLPGVDEGMNLPRDVYCGIVQGDITQWNDPALVEANPDIELPDLPITWAHRSDGSGTTFIFVNHIDTVCPDWTAGVGTSVDWPVGVGGQGNEGVSAQIQQNEGTIGYVEFAYAKLNELPTAALENAAGNFIMPSADTASLAFEGEEIPEDFGLLVPNPSNPEAYPIAGLTWILVYPEYTDAQTWEALKDVMMWALNEGDDIAAELDYVPMPSSIIERIETVLDEVKV